MVSEMSNADGGAAANLQRTFKYLLGLSISPPSINLHFIEVEYFQFVILFTYDDVHV